MSTTLRRVYQFELQSVAGNNLLGTIDDLNTFAPSNSVIVIDIVSYAESAFGGSSGFIEFCNFNRRQLVISNVSGSFTLLNSHVIYNKLNSSGSTDIVWTDSLSGTDLNFDVDCQGIQQSVFITATVTFQQ